MQREPTLNERTNDFGHSLGDVSMAINMRDFHLDKHWWDEFKAWIVLKDSLDGL
jgi:hypothetical protein